MSPTGRPEGELPRSAQREGTPVTTGPVATPRARQKVGVDALADFPDRVDVRTPLEFADDHLPAAENQPVLSNDERVRVGTLHAQESEFVAKRVGAALVARNIATMLENAFADRPRSWAPLVYCWRGGKRSGALAHMLNEIGWKAVQLDGGYRSYRRHVLARLAVVPPQYSYRVVCGLTGSGKSRLLGALAEVGAQVLDLEGLARHRGSLLGDLPADPQPSQRRFESLLLERFERLDPRLPVFVESESRKIGSLQVPEVLLAAMRGAECIRVDTPTSLRVALLKDEYAHFLADPATLHQRLLLLTPLHGRATIARWTAAASAGEWDQVVAELLTQHYDPTYARAIERNFVRLATARRIAPCGVGHADFRALAQCVVDDSPAAALNERLPP
jgi:tRNA 2-selenouridine synthase